MALTSTLHQPVKWRLAHRFLNVGQNTCLRLCTTSSSPQERNVIIAFHFGRFIRTFLLGDSRFTTVSQRAMRCCSFRSCLLCSWSSRLRFRLRQEAFWETAKIRRCCCLFLNRSRWFGDLASGFLSNIHRDTMDKRKNIKLGLCWAEKSSQRKSRLIPAP